MKPLIDVDKYFDHIYCINLKSRSDRLTDFKKNFGALGTSRVTIFEAVDGKKIDPGTWQYNLGALGCRLSHLGVYKDALAKKYSKILILEDDVVIQKNFRKKLSHLIGLVNEDWDLIYFGGNHYLKPDIIDQEIIKLNNTLTTHALAINGKCLERVIQKAESDERWIDSVIADLHLELKAYGFLKPVAHQRRGYSDIEERKVIYNLNLLDKLLFKIKHIIKPAN